MLKYRVICRLSSIRIIFLFFLVLCHVTYNAAPIARAEGAGLVVSPPFQEVIIGRTGDKTVSLTLTNRTAISQTLALTSVDFKSLNESGGVAFLGAQASDLERKYGLSNWMKLNDGQITLSSGQSQIVTVEIENLPNLSPGGHYGAVLFRVEPGEKAREHNKVAVEQQLGSLIFLKKIGGERYGLELDGVDKPKNWNSSHRSVNLKFKNTGNVHAVPRGTVELLSSGGKQVAKSNINLESGILLPEANRKYPVKLSGGLLKPGRYTLQVAYRYDGMTQVKTYRETIYLFDAWFAAAVGAACLAAITASFFAMRWVWVRKKSKKLGRKTP